MKGAYDIRPIGRGDKEAVGSILRRFWGSPRIVSRGRLHDGDSLPGFAAFGAAGMTGLITYNIENRDCEIVSLNSLREGAGIGSALIEAVRRRAAEHGCRRLWLITTNDNTPAIEFYKRRGFKIAAVHKGAIAESRKLKPSIALYGIDGVPITDEIEMETWLRPVS